MTLPIALTAALLIICGCAGAKKTAKTDDDATFRQAEEYFAKKKYDKTITTLELLRYTPSILSDDAHLLTAKAHIAAGNPELASPELAWIKNRYSQSELIEEATFLLAESYFLASPRAELDQELTHKAIGAYKDFLDLYPTSKFADSAKVGIEKAQDKLAQKLLQSAVLYHNMHQDSAALLYVRTAIDTYPQTSLMAQIELLYAQVLVELGDTASAQNHAQRVIESSPSDKTAAAARKLLAKIATP